VTAGPWGAPRASALAGVATATTAEGPGMASRGIALLAKLLTFVPRRNRALQHSDNS
jgi:hypothetical protein